jgi:CBS-domain-containing membrane protein
MFDKKIEVREIMTRDVIMVSPEETMDRAAELFEIHDLHHLPVVGRGKVTGMLSTTDLHKVMHHFTLFKVRNSEVVNQSVLRSLLIKEVMSKPVATIQSNCSLTTVAEIFRENLFHALPVVEANGDIAGIVTPFDLLNYAYGPEELELTESHHKETK